MVLVEKWHFSTFFLDNIVQEIFFYDVLERKNVFLGYKNNKFKKSKNGDFSKGVNPWCPKMAMFRTFFLGNRPFPHSYKQRHQLESRVDKI